MPGISITFLGTGTSQGVPVIGCTCDVCRSPDPRDKRLRSSIFVETEEFTWVVDTGTDFRTQCLRAGISHLDAVVYTHAHTDHIMGFDDLRAFCADENDFPIYASAETMTDLQRVFAFAFNGQNRFPGYIRPDPHIISGPFSLGRTQLIPLPVRHGRIEVYGYLLIRDGVKCAVYLSDCKEIPPNVVDIIRGTNVLIIDALRRRPHPTHLSFAEAIALSREAEIHQTWFTHLAHEARHADLEKELPPNIRVSYDGLKIEV